MHIFRKRRIVAHRARAWHKADRVNKFASTATSSPLLLPLPPNPPSPDPGPFTSATPGLVCPAQLQIDGVYRPARPRHTVHPTDAAPPTHQHDVGLVGGWLAGCAFERVQARTLFSYVLSVGDIVRENTSS